MLLAHGGVPDEVSPWTWHPHFDVWFLIAGIAAAYFLALRSGVRRGEAPATRRQITTFLVGLGVLWAASDYPIHDLSEGYLFSVHMAQHLMITLIAVPLMLVGIPTWLLERYLVRPKAVYAVVRRLSKPLIATIIYNATTVFTHWPTVVNAALNHHYVHFFFHVLLFVTAGLMWLPVLNKSDLLPRLRGSMRMVYLFLQSVIPTGPASFITFASTPVYSFYANVPHPFGMTAVEDQQVAGAVMKIGGGAVLWTVIVVLFFRWYNTEENGGRDRMQRDQVAFRQMATKSN